MITIHTINNKRVVNTTRNNEVYCFEANTNLRINYKVSSNNKDVSTRAINSKIQIGRTACN